MVRRAAARRVASEGATASVVNSMNPPTRAQLHAFRQDRRAGAVAFTWGLRKTCLSKEKFEPALFHDTFPFYFIHRLCVLILRHLISIRKNGTKAMDSGRARGLEISRVPGSAGQSKVRRCRKEGGSWREG